jgi:hypothetical protein
VFHSVPRDYVDRPPKDMGVVSRNLKILQVLFRQICLKFLMSSFFQGHLERP